MKTIKASLIAACATAFSVSSTFAQDDLLEYLVSECKSDIENYCAQVTPGDGRMLHCMAAHEDKISGQCNYALYRAANLLEQLSMALNYLAQECRTDIETHCSGVRVGEGRVVSCLAENDSTLTPGCRTALGGSDE